MNIVKKESLNVMTSWHGNVFHITPLCGPEQAAEQTVELPVTLGAMPLM